MAVNIDDLLTDLVASPPTIYQKLQSAVNQPETSFDDFAAIISADPSLSARLLRIVNSSFYGFKNKIETITHALSIVGTEQLLDLALATVIIDKFKGIPKDLVSMDSFWKHSISTGLLSRIVAGRIGEMVTERFYLAGLLHDIGCLVIYKQIPVIARMILNQAQEDKQPHHVVEQEVLGFTHGEVGNRLMEAWNLPERYAETAQCHNAPETAVKFPKYSLVVHLADHTVYDLGLGTSGEPGTPPLADNILPQIGLTEEDLTELKQEVIDQYQEAMEMFM